MRNKAIRLAALAVASSLLVATTTFAADVSKAKDTVDSIREADPPQVSTTTKESPLGQSTTDYHPTGPSVKTKEPPSPVNKLNPQNDPDVQRGLDGK